MKKSILMTCIGFAVALGFSLNAIAGEIKTPSCKLVAQQKLKLLSAQQLAPVAAPASAAPAAVKAN